jgi:hypothetical protein
MKAVVFTSDSHSWLLRGFFHQWEKHASQGTRASNVLELEVAGYTQPAEMPSGVPFFSIGAMADYPVQRWSDGVIRYLEQLEDELVVFLLEDYWLIRPVNHQAIQIAHAFMLEQKSVARFDLTTDRMYAKGARYAGPYGAIDIVAAKGEYSLSFQASIYRRKMLLELLRPGETPWEAEINGTGRLNHSPYGVVGCYQWPINYLVAVNKGQLDRTGGWMFPARTLTKEDWDELDQLGYTTQPETRRREHAL